jgi:glycerol transport system ATP-binding protein
MARIDLQQLRHSYLPNPTQDADYALKQVDLVWEDGGAYALLGPSGCGKTTLLNIISGLLTPTEGSILFNGMEVTDKTPEERQIAQVFQFPVVYDTMTVYDNLAFPLRNRGVPERQVDARVRAIADMTGLVDMLNEKAAGLSADGKQKISLGRGLVREDVNVIMFDEPLTVIDPHLKWKLRSKLKELHQRVKTTMIYVTHDQTEALTFADKVVVMHEGWVVQEGTPVELFEHPRHTFVGHFIGSPGMNLMPCALVEGGASVSGHRVALARAIPEPPTAAKLELGVRPEFVQFAEPGAADGLPASVVSVRDTGRHRIVETDFAGHKVRALVPAGLPVPEGSTRIRFDPGHTQIYADDWIIASPIGR